MSGTAGGGGADFAVVVFAFGAFGSLGALGSLAPSENEKLLRSLGAAGGFSSFCTSSATGPRFRRKSSESLISLLRSISKPSRGRWVPQSAGLGSVPFSFLPTETPASGSPTLHGDADELLELRRQPAELSGSTRENQLADSE